VTVSLSSGQVELIWVVHCLMHAKQNWWAQQSRMAASCNEVSKQIAQAGEDSCMLL
jgi:hypothetical protein